MQCATNATNSISQNATVANYFLIVLNDKKNEFAILITFNNLKAILTKNQLYTNDTTLGLLLYQSGATSVLDFVH